MFKSNQIIILGLAVGMALFVGSAQAGKYMRCDGGIVSIGDDMFDLIERCGTPDAEASYGDRRPVKSIWFYKNVKGWNYKLYLLDEKVKSIDKEPSR